jgi:putative transposase
MSRIARIVALDLPHHITQRGNNRADVFFDNNDRSFYLQTLRKYCLEFKLEIWTYCLMNNHVHLLAVPQYQYSLAQGIGRTNLVYTQYINKKYNRSGRLWQNRFFSCPVDKEQYLWAVARYIETNPLRARLVKQPWDYQWSSARHHTKGITDVAVSESDWLRLESRDEYIQFIKEQSEDEIILIRKATLSGRPLGQQKFIVSLEKSLGRQLQIQNPGRPRVK